MKLLENTISRYILDAPSVKEVLSAINDYKQRYGQAPVMMFVNEKMKDELGKRVTHNREGDTVNLGVGNDFPIKLSPLVLGRRGFIIQFNVPIKEEHDESQTDENV